MKILKWILITLFSIAAIIAITIFFWSQSRPQGEASPEADVLAQRMMQVLNHHQYTRSNFFKWTFAGKHDYIYYRPTNKVKVSWDNNEVFLLLNTRKGRTYVDGIEVIYEEKEELLQKAWEYWCNDSFWVLAPFKVFDPGTVRKIVKDKDGKEGLLVEYTSGGATPGDAYLRYLDEHYVPTGWRMWTSIIPVQGLYVSWESWERHNEALYSLNHKTLIDIEISNFGVFSNWRLMGHEDHPLEPLINY